MTVLTEPILSRSNPFGKLFGNSKTSLDVAEPQVGIRTQTIRPDPVEPNSTVAKPTVSSRSATSADQLLVDSLLAALETSVTAEDGHSFQVGVEAMNWSELGATDIARVIRWALEIQAPLIARELSAVGHRRYPDDAELGKMARILAPPVVKSETTTVRLDLRANRDWLRANRDAYRGKWIALRRGELVSVANSADELLKQVGDVRNTGILITSVW